MKLVERGDFVISSIDIRIVFNRFLVEFSEKTGQTTHLGILDAGHGVYIDKVEGHAAIITYSRIGRQLPPHCTALGKVLVAFQDDQTKKRSLQGYSYNAITARTITNGEAFLREIETVRDQGCAVDDQEHLKGVRCAAVPIFDHKGKITAAISLFTLTATVNNRDFERYSGLLNSISDEISALIGHRS